MPNWKRLVRERLAVLRLPPERESEIVAEVALRLEATYMSGTPRCGVTTKCGGAGSSSARG